MAKLPKPKPEQDFDLTIQGQPWMVHFVPDLKSEEGIDLCGLSDADHLKILIRAGLPPRLRLLTFWHEVGHSIVSAINTHDNPALAGYVCEEHMAELMGRTMAEILEQRFLLPAWCLNDGMRKKEK